MKANYDALVTWNTESRVQEKKKLYVIWREFGNNYQRNNSFIK